MSRRTCSTLLLLTILLVGPGLAFAQERLHRSVLAAFREAVAAPANSTVQVYCDSHTAALGTIVDAGGYIVTKASELEGKVECQMNAPGKRYPAIIVATDKDLDLAVLKIDAKDLPVIAWSDGEAPGVGSWLVTPGLSRDPLAIGVLSVSPRRIGSPPGALGIHLARIDKPATIDDIVVGSAAQKAGLEVGDVVLKVNGKAVAGSQELVETIRGYRPGEQVELVIKRGDQELTKTAVLTSLAKVFDMEDNRAEFQNNLGGHLSERRYGFPSVIQHDSVLKPSECGGPIVDLDGKAVGINIARAGRVESYALPAKVVREAVKKMLLETHQTSTSVER
jgi:Trypsin-like serine proteases, typically periplasmic, contain C-terminal PDZ domain